MIRGVTYPKLAWETLENISPSELNSTAQLEFTENLTVGSEIGSFVANDLNYPSEVSFSLSPSSQNREMFTLDLSGTLKTATTFDYESNASSYTITIQAKDELNATTEGNFTVTLLNANDTPNDLNSTDALSFQENQPVGTMIGEFNATDPDGASITYHFVNGENNNSLFTLDTNGTLKTATIFDYESNLSTYTITVQVKDELNASTEGNFTVTLLNKNERPYDLKSSADFQQFKKSHIYP